MTIRIANGAGFLGDNLDAPRLLVENAEVDYLTLEYLAELTMSILARKREKDPATGYAGDFLDVLRSLLPALKAQPQLKIVTNAGGMNPQACATAAAKILNEAGLGDMHNRCRQRRRSSASLAQLQSAGCRFENLDTEQPLTKLGLPIVSANAYLGAQPIAEALAGGARIVITGRVADASLTVGPAAHEFGWKWDDWNRLAGGSVAGHLIECGAQVTGGLYRHWQNLDLANVGYPIAEINDDGSCIITKPKGTGGAVNRNTVIEQLVYEIGDPAHYLTPDVDVDFTTVEVKDAGPDRVAVQGATGRTAPDNYKVSLAYSAGFTASGTLVGHRRRLRGKSPSLRRDDPQTCRPRRIQTGKVTDRMPRRRRWRAKSARSTFSQVPRSCSPRLRLRLPPPSRRTLHQRIRPADHQRPARSGRLRHRPSASATSFCLLAYA